MAKPAHRKWRNNESVISIESLAISNGENMWRMAKEITKMARGGSKYHGVMKATKSNEMA
jgi:hypothetical protein